MPHLGLAPPIKKLLITQVPCMQTCGQGSDGLALVGEELAWRVRVLDWCCNQQAVQQVLLDFMCPTAGTHPSLHSPVELVPHTL